MSDRTICNKLFNAFCILAVLFVVVSIISGVCVIATGASNIVNDTLTIEELKTNVIIDLFNNLYRGTMIFLCTFFAYDSAKMQLKKANLTK